MNEHQFIAIYDKYVNRLVEFLNYYTRNTSDIEDVIQEVFVKLWENKDYIEITHITTYLYSMARNKMLNKIRNERNRTRLLTNWADTEYEKQKAEDCYDPCEFDTLLNKAINELPQTCRRIFIMNKFEKLTYKQISEKQGVSVKTVEAQMSMSLKRIKLYIIKISVFLVFFDFISKGIFKLECLFKY